jgi:hypothetical protein
MKMKSWFRKIGKKVIAAAVVMMLVNPEKPR